MKVLLRCDAGPAVGLGHVMRCLGLAQACRDAGADALFIGSSFPASVRDRLADEECGVIEHGSTAGTAADVAATLDCAADGAAALVVDSYAFNAATLGSLLAAAESVPVLRIDDDQEPRVLAGEFVLAPVGHDPESEIAAQDPAASRRLFGPRFVPLCREHLGPPPATTSDGGGAASDRVRVLVTMGGSDPAGLTLPAVEALASLAAEGLRLEVLVLVGGAHASGREILDAVAAAGPDFTGRTDARDMAAILRGTDLVLGAAGSTCWEAAHHGCAMILAPVADNQRPVAAALDAAGAADILDAGPGATAGEMADAVRRVLGDRDRMTAMANAGAALVDGHGAARAAMRVLDLQVRLRRAEPGDSEQYWMWANDPDVRRWSFRSAPIPWDDHQRWFTGRLTRPRTMLLVGHDRMDQPVGQVRVEWDEDGVGTIGISLDAAARGRRLAVPLLDMAARRAFRDPSLGRIDAFIKHNNETSIAAFRRAGFTAARHGTVDGTPCLVLARTRTDAGAGAAAAAPSFDPAAIPAPAGGAPDARA